MLFAARPKSVVALFIFVFVGAGENDPPSHMHLAMVGDRPLFSSLQYVVNAHPETRIRVSADLRLVGCCLEFIRLADQAQG